MVDDKDFIDEENFQDDTQDPFENLKDDQKEEFKPLSSKHYNKLGFYCAIHPNGKPNGELAKLLNDLQNYTNDRLKQYDDRYKHIIEHIDNKIKMVEAKLVEEKENLDKHRKKPEELKEKQEKIETEIETIRGKLKTIYVKLANEKQKLIDRSLPERLVEIDNELKKLIDNHQILAEKKYKLSQEIYRENEPVFDQKVKRFTRLKEELEKIYCFNPLIDWNKIPQIRKL